MQTVLYSRIRIYRSANHCINHNGSIHNYLTLLETIVPMTQFIIHVGITFVKGGTKSHKYVSLGRSLVSSVTSEWLQGIDSFTYTARKSVGGLLRHITVTIVFEYHSRRTQFSGSPTLNDCVFVERSN